MDVGGGGELMLVLFGSAVVHVSLGGPTKRIRIGSRTYEFEDHPEFGPTPLRKNGDVRDLGHRHRFWLAVTQWYLAGKVIDADGYCTWAEPKDETEGMVRVGKRTWATPELAERVTGSKRKT